jgi:hypothetical protein
MLLPYQIYRLIIYIFFRAIAYGDLYWSASHAPGINVPGCTWKKERLNIGQGE